MPHSTSIVFEFGPFQLNAAQRVLTRGYAGIIDCDLRLVANYLPPEASTREREDVSETSSTAEAQSKLKLRHEWDWKGAERELRRAKERKVGYPAAHQWHAAYVFARNLYLQYGEKSDSSGVVAEA